MKGTERLFLNMVIKNGGKIPSDYLDKITKQEYYYLEKWTGKGWWEYGVSMRTGWLEKEAYEYFHSTPTAETKEDAKRALKSAGEDV